MDVNLDVGVNGGEYKKSLEDLHTGLIKLRDTNAQLSQEMQEGAGKMAASEQSVAKAVLDTNKVLEEQKKIGTDLSTNATKTFAPEPVVRYNTSLKEASTLLKTLSANGGKQILSKNEINKMTVDLINAKDEFAALGVILDVTKEKMSEFDQTTPEFQEMTAAVQAAEVMLESMNTETDEAAVKQQNLEQRLREVTFQLAEMKQQGLDNTQQYRELKAEAADMYDTMQDVRDEIKQAGSDTKGFDHLIRTASLVTGGFQAAQGAMALFGAEDEDTQKALLKVTAAMSILNGLQVIQGELLQKDSVARGFLIALQKQWTASIYETNIALRLFKIALIATGIGVFIVALGFAAEAMGFFGEETEDAADKQKKLNDELEKSKQLLGDLADKGLTERNARKEGLNELRRELVILEARGASERKIADQKQQILDKELGNLRYLRSTYEDYSDEVLKIDQQILDKENEKAALKITLSKQLADKRKEDNEKEKKDIEDITKFIKNEEAARIQAIKDSRERELAELLRSFETEIDVLQENYTRILSTQKLTEEQRSRLKESYEKQRGDIAAKYAVQSIELEAKHASDLKSIQDAAYLVLLELNGNQKAKELDLLDKKYQEQREKIVAAGKLTTEVEKALIEAKNKELQEVNNKYAEEELKKQEELEIARINVLKDDKYSPAFLEEIKQKKVLEVQLKYAKIRLKALEAIGGKENELAVLQTKKLIGDLQKQIEDSTENRTINQWLAESLGLTDSQFSEFEGRLKDAFGKINELVTAGIQAQIDAKQQEIDILNTQIDEKESELDREYSLQEQGYSNNVEAKKEEINELKKQRDADIEAQKIYQRQLAKVEGAKQAVSAASTIASLIQSAATLTQQWTVAVPLVGAGLGLAAAATLIAGFAGIKNTVKANQSLGEGGRVKGKKHSQGGNKFMSMDGNDPYIVEIEQGEQVTRAAMADKYGALLDAVNNDELSSMTFSDLMRLINPNQVHFDTSIPEQVVSAVSTANEIKHSGRGSGMQNVYLQQIAASNYEMLSIEKGKTKSERIGDDLVETSADGNHIKITKGYYNGR